MTAEPNFDENERSTVSHPNMALDAIRDVVIIQELFRDTCSKLNMQSVSLLTISIFFGYL